MSRSKQLVNLSRGCLLLLAASSLGCWEKIEYTGTPSPPPAKNAAATDNSQAESSPADTVKSAAPVVPPLDAGSVAKSTVAPATPEATTPAPAITPTAKSAADDRYALPPSSNAKGSPVMPAVPPSSPASPPVGVAEARNSAAPPQEQKPSSTNLPPTSPVPLVAAASPASNGAVFQSPSLPASSPAKPAEAHLSNPAPTTTATPKTAEGVTPKAAETTSAKSLANTRLAAWQLGSGMSLAALAHDRGVAKDKVPAWFAQAQSAAKQLGVTVAELPTPAPPADTNPASKQVMNYLLVDGQRIGRELTKQYGPATSALFEVAIKSNILLLLYAPGSTEGASIADAVSDAAPRAKLPGDLWKPLVDQLDRQLPASDVRLAVQKLHTDVGEYLKGAAGQGSR
jgi:hypothetical protein